MADPHHLEDPGLLANPTTWLAVSFAIFAFITYRFGKSAIINMLDQRIEKIKHDLESSENLRVEAQELLAQYERKHRDAVKEAETIIANAEKHAEGLKKEADIELQKMMERKEKQLQNRLERMKASAIAEIQSYAADIAIKATKEIITTKLDDQTGTKLVEDSITNIGKNLH